MDKVALSASARSTDTSVKNLRKQGQIPGVVYGNKTENTAIQMEEVALMKAYVKAGESTLVDLDIGGKKLPVLFHEVSFDPVTDRMDHVDFYAVDMNKEVEAEVPVHFEGESAAVKEGGILVTALDHITVRCLPSNLPHDFKVELSKLAAFGDSITVADLSVPEKVEILNEADAVIAVVQEPRAEEVAEAPVAAEGAEGAAPAEGEAAAPAAPKKIPGNPEN
jgi:large subunit ribosomal protein L25